MKELSFEIQGHKDDKNIVEISNYFSGYDDAVKLHNGIYTASWLLNDIHDKNEWIVKTNRAFLNKDGSYSYARKIKWDRLLPNGTSLSDDRNKPIRLLIQKLNFISHESPLINNNGALISLLSAGTQTGVIISWLILNEDKIQPNAKSLTMLSQSWLKEFVLKIIYGGAFNLLDTGQRIISKISNDTGHVISYKNIFNLPQKARNQVIRYLERKNLYRLNYHRRNIVDKKSLCILLGISKQEIMSHKATLFFRQFEPDIMKYNDKVLSPSDFSTEFPTHKTPLIQEVSSKTYSSSYVNQYISIIEKWFRLKDCFPGDIPEPEVFRFNDLRDLTKNHGRTNNVTPWIPVDISMHLLI